MAQDAVRLRLDQLRWRCEPASLGFATTDEVAPVETTVGQERGAGAIALGLAVPVAGYNIYVAGGTGTGRTTAVRHEVAHAAARKPPAPDWCYLHNFAEPARPVAVELPAGEGPALARDLDVLVAGCRREIPRVFRGEDYEQHRTDLMHELQARREQIFAELRAFADEVGFGLKVSQTGVVTMPLLGPDTPVTAETFARLTDTQRAEIREKGERLDRKTEQALAAVQKLEREILARLRELDRQTLLATVGHMLEALRVRYAAQPRVLTHLDAIQADLLERIDDIRMAGEGRDASAGGTAAISLLASGGLQTPDERYRANVFVTHDPQNGAPVVFEPNPTYYNLTGRIDY
ncbi:MAG TPA: Lon-like protease helical domain-containing protein, partial [Chloroflexota bacterium]|nr:Lon-like protease helical domain-containing protein [Chloroflexota bacterium]